MNCKTCPFTIVVLVAAAAFGLWALIGAGCQKQEEKPTETAAAVNVRWGLEGAFIADAATSMTR